MEQDETEVVVFETLMQWCSTCRGPWAVFIQKYPIKHFAMPTPCELVENILHIGQERFIKDSWNLLLATRNSFLNTDGPPGPR